MEAAPYSGLIVQLALDSKAQEDELTKQSVQVTLDDSPVTIRPGALFLLGVDKLLTDDIKAFVNYYVNFRVNEDQNEDEKQEKYIQVGQTPFRIQWINDSLANVVFETHESAREALEKLTGQELVMDAEFVDNGAYVQELVKLRPCLAYGPVESFKKTQSLFARIDKGTEDQMEDDLTEPALSVRQAVSTDVKVKDAAMYSRYYLFNGDPERHNTVYRPGQEEEVEKVYDQQKRRRERKGRGRKQRGDVHEEQVEEEEDLFAHRLRGDDEDLFADRLREASPSRRGPKRDRRDRGRERRSRGGRGGRERGQRPPSPPDAKQHQNQNQQDAVMQE